MKSRKKWVYLGLAALILLAALAAWLWPRPLSKVINEPFWKETTYCTISDFDPDKLQFETELVLGECFPNVKVRGPYPEKNAAFSSPDGAWLEVHALWPIPDQADSHYNLRLTIFREKLEGKNSMKYSVNVGSQCYVVVSGEEEVEAFIQRVYQIAEENDGTKVFKFGGIWGDHK